MSTTRIGLIGYGQIGQAVHKMIESNADNGMEVVFVHDQFAAAVESLPSELAQAARAAYAARRPHGGVGGMDALLENH